ncbi:MAG: hypothetical protein NC310_00545 [Roseburia sp.]|nr:hypothetical protein [Anaeroplasma bactoclasticum]MCM1195541.1 hypothetical protein [Roseburia sp.]MCM1557788.1 hypothetical protein [Anaeroplasma bactoclasticum]
MRKWFVFVSLCLIVLGLCSCVEDPNKDLKENQFQFTEEEQKENRKLFTKFENEMNQLENQLEGSNSFLIDLNISILGKDSSISSNSKITSCKKPLYISLEANHQPVLMFEEIDSSIQGYVFDNNQNGYIKNVVDKDDIEDLLEDNGFEEDDIFDLYPDSKCSKISLDTSYKIEVYTKDILRDEIMDLIDFKTFGLSFNDLDLNAKTKYSFSISSNQLEAMIEIPFCQQENQKEKKYTILLEYSVKLDIQFDKLDLSLYHNLSFPLGEQIQFTSIENPIVSHTMAQNDVYKIKLTRGVYVVDNPKMANLWFYEEDGETLHTNSINYGQTEFLLIEEACILFMEVRNSLNEGYSLTFHKQSNIVKNDIDLPNKVNYEFKGKYDYIIYELPDGFEEFITMRNNTSRDIWFGGASISSVLPANKAISSFIGKDKLIFINVEDNAMVLDIDVFVPIDYGKIDISAKTSQYYVIGGQGFTGTFTYKLPKTGYYRFEFTDENGDVFYPKSNLYGTDINTSYHGFEESTYSIEIYQFILEEPGLYQLSIQMIE